MDRSSSLGSRAPIGRTLSHPGGRGRSPRYRNAERSPRGRRRRGRPSSHARFGPRPASPFHLRAARSAAKAVRPRASGRAATPMACRRELNPTPAPIYALRYESFWPIVPTRLGAGGSVTDKAIITVGDTTLEAPLVIGTEGERAFDIGQLRAKTGYVTIDPAFMNTA